MRAFIAPILAAALATAGSAAPALAQASENYRVNFDALNDSGVTGHANLELKDGRYLTIIINARGLEPGGVHLGHVHGLVEDGEAVDSQCPTIAADTDEDGFVELGEGVPLYGGILIPLGNVDPDADGKVNYKQTFDLMDSSDLEDGVTMDDLTPLHFREIVLHGMTVPPGPGEGTTGEVDGENGYLAVLPVACGPIEGVGGGRQGAKTVRF